MSGGVRGVPRGASADGSLEARLGALLAGSDAAGPGDRVVVALSGGLDSVVLLHLFRFGCPLPGLSLHAAHFDHRMRGESEADADWVRGLCRAWRVPLHEERACAVPASEAAAREARYDFLRRARSAACARLVLTAHHADDQAETVLFRAVRGTGQLGLAGIPARREPALWRPLLGFWRAELEEYARRMRLSWREDPTNEDTRYARNALRRHILPELERLVVPGDRRALVRLADLAREDEAGWESVLPAVMAPLEPRAGEGSASLDAVGLAGLHPAVRARVLRRIASDLGLSLDEGATRLAVDFAASAGSGRRIGLGAGWTLRRELGRLVLGMEASHPPDEPLRIPDRNPGSGRVRLSGRSIDVVWGARVRAGVGAGPHVATFDADELLFPLSVRARAPGDRIRLPGGTKKVKKLFLERRIPEARRGHVPLVVDAAGDVLWIPAVARAVPRPGPTTGGALGIAIA